MRQTTRLWTAILIGGFALAPTLSAQAAPPTASLQGVVVDSATRQPLPNVLVRMDTGPRTLSDEEGRFRLDGLEPGSHVFALLTADCGVTWGDIDLETGQSHATLVRVAASEEAARAEKEARHRRRSQGEVVTAAEIQAMAESSLAEVIRRVAPNMVGSPSGQFGRSTSVRGRARNSFVSTAPEPVVVVDGVRVDDPATALDLIPPAEVAILEILPGAAGGWEFGSDGAAGLIRVTTRQGGDTSSGPEDCTVPDFPRG